MGAIEYSISVSTSRARGNYWNGTLRRAQLCVWGGSSLALEGVKTWYSARHTRIDSVACADVDGDAQVEIVTGGYYYDGTRLRAQLAVWNGSTLALEGVRAWHWVSYTYLLSVAIGDVDGDGETEIVAGGYYDDESRDVAQLYVWGL